MCLPDVDKVILRATDNVLTISTEGGLNLAAGVQTTLVLAGQFMVLQVVETHARVIRRHQQLEGKQEEKK